MASEKKKWVYKPGWFMCRGIVGHHSYNRTGAIVFSDGAYHLHMPCINCEVVCRKEIKRDGAVKSRYKHPQGYINHDMSKPTRAALRIHAVNAIVARQKRKGRS